ncbi:hypothetical protein [Aliamphritea hakodatensis]|uniref:hypothetical protein n=1 Tax=Aliamphritea hakodatensis TaxID=2895352 RepID=UPI0022FD71A2|nr:hypothetical protein [Aliamphritea hakodatensis]
MRLITSVIAAITLLPALCLAATQPAQEACREAFQTNMVAAALAACEPLAEQGDGEAAFLAARTYSLHFDDFQSQANALKWLQVARQAGLPEAGYYLGLAYQHGQGTYIDLDKAIGAYRFSADKNNPHAQRNLGMLYKEGNGVPRDGAKAFELISRSAKAGIIDSQLTAGVMLLRGEGVEKNERLGHSWIKQAAVAGNQDAQLALGIMYSDLDIEASINWYEQAAAQDNPYALYHLAILYLKGLRVPQDLQKAREYARHSAELGHLSSSTLLQSIDERLAQISPEERAAKAEEEAAKTVISEKLKSELVPHRQHTPQAKVAVKTVTAPAPAKPATAPQPSKAPMPAKPTKPASTPKAITLAKPAPATEKPAAPAPKVSTKNLTSGQRLTAISKPAPVAAAPAVSGLQSLEWILLQPGKEYLTQLVQLATLEQVDVYIRQHKLSGKVIYFPARTQLGDVYIILFRTGVTRIKQARIISREALPASLVDNAWIRPFKSLQKAVRPAQ